jgi:hypothetical protein
MKRHRINGHGIRLVDRVWIRSREAEMRAAIKEAFRGAHFKKVGLNFDFGPDTKQYGLDTVLSSCIDGQFRDSRRTLVALDGDGKISAAVFHIPTSAPGGKRSGGYGWFFTSPRLPLDQRVALAKHMIEQTHGIMRRRGFRRIAVNMGTREGELFLKKRFGYKPLDGHLNTWVKEL